MRSLSAVVLFLCVTGVWCHECNLTKPHFESRNFHHVLHWNEADVPGEVALYSVQYLTYGGPYKPVAWCQNISVPVCDLTSVMIVTDVTTRYHVKITAAGRCVGELLFYPYQQTILEAPELSVSWNETSLNVTVSPPMDQNIDCWGVCQHPMKFTVNLTQPKFHAGRVYESTTGSVLVWPVETHTEYCGDAVYSFTHPSSPRQSDKASFCVTVTAPNSWFHVVLLPALLAVVLLIILPMILCQQSVKRKHLLPKALILSKNNALPFRPDVRDEISKVQLCSGFIGNLPKLYLQAPVVPEGSKVTGNWSSYAPQDSRDQEASTRCSSGEHSVNYSMIVGVQTPDAPSADVESSELSGPEFVWPREHHNVSNSDTHSEPLVVPVIPSANGTLQLNGFLFQPDSESRAFGERTPLLTDLVVEDLGCNSKYPSVDVSEISKCLYPDLTPVVSNYRQNGMPATPLEGHEGRRTYILRTGHMRGSSEVQEETKEDEEGFNGGQNFLDRWMLKMEG
ncbi:interferon lambda receptor 1 [Triplophysa rosa]|uniref:Interferon lambda receptor 1 n=1 Tax=Triplophysa rosa TaxID=992332 RepID=A0A9W8C3I0_TRIRA|nr:interferon lambda receptor 1 [Triplophysa rosa]KAI7806517.1 interferon lambda receptor 1 precursor [Triplophysa rosa]